MSQFFATSGESIEASASASVLPMNIQVSFRTDWFDLLAFQGTLKSLVQHHNSKASILWYSAIHDYCKNHSFDYMDLCWQSDVSTF